MSTTGLCWLNHSEQMMLRQLLKVAAANNDVRDAMAGRIMELERDNNDLRAEIDKLQCMRHAEISAHKNWEQSGPDEHGNRETIREKRQ